MARRRPRRARGRGACGAVPCAGGFCEPEDAPGKSAVSPCTLSARPPIPPGRSAVPMWPPEAAGHAAARRIVATPRAPNCRIWLWMSRRGRYDAAGAGVGAGVVTATSPDRPGGEGDALATMRACHGMRSLCEARVLLPRGVISQPRSDAP
eukprot:351669-Chlamydomonas_euryale.AAC.6